MTTTTPGSYAGNSTADHTRTVRRSTETKAGPKTTEFMFMVAFIVAVLVATYIDGDDSLAKENGWLYAAIVASAYFISRGLAKLGVRDPYSADVDAR
jgi:hypothetical protein